MYNLLVRSLSRVDYGTGLGGVLNLGWTASNLRAENHGTPSSSSKHSVPRSARLLVEPVFPIAQNHNSFHCLFRNNHRVLFYRLLAVGSLCIPYNLFRLRGVWPFWCHTGRRRVVLGHTLNTQTLTKTDEQKKVLK